MLKGFAFHKNIGYLLISFWVTLFVLCLLGALGDMKELGLGFLVALVSAPFIFKGVSYYQEQPEDVGKKFFFSKMGYVAAGFCLALIVIAITFNIMYSSGWFDFTDFFFYIFSLPLSYFLKFTPNDDEWPLRLALYAVTFLNLTLITYTFDLVGLLVAKIRKKL